MIRADTDDTLLTGHDNGLRAKRCETMKIRIDNPNNCLYCGRKLSILHLLRDLLYCDTSHRSAHTREVGELALSRLFAEAKSPSEMRWEQCERRMKAEELKISR